MDNLPKVSNLCELYHNLFYQLGLKSILLHMLTYNTIVHNKQWDWAPGCAYIKPSPGVHGELTIII